MPNALVNSMRTSIARQIARAFGMADADADAVTDDVEEQDHWTLTGRKAQRAAGVRRLSPGRRRPRMRPTPHPVWSRPLGKVTPEAAERRVKQVERLQAAYNRTVEAGEQWIAPDVEQAERDRRAARTRTRAGRRAARSR